MKKITLSILGMLIGPMSLLAQQWNQLGETFQYTGQPVNTVTLSGDGNVMAISPSYAANSGVDHGIARIYSFDGTNWVQMGADINYGGVHTGGSYGDMASLSLTLTDDGQTLVIGAPYSEDYGDASGKVGIFTFDGSQWTQSGSDLEGEVQYHFGSKVSINADGTKLVASGDLHNTGGNSGQVKVFELTDGTWTQLGQTLYHVAFEGGNQLGYDVDINDAGNRIVASFYTGAPARIYQLDGAVWLQTATLSAAGSSPGYVSFNASGDTVALGSFEASSATGSMMAGKAVVYKEENGTWAQVGSPLYGTAMFQLFSRVRLNAEGNVLAVGSEGLSSSKGKVELYQIVNDDWLEIGEIIDTVNGTFYGSSVGLSNDGYTVGIGSREGAGSATAQYARAFEFDCVPDAPSAESIQEFEAGETLADLEITATQTITWYADEALTEVLEPTTATQTITWYADEALTEVLEPTTALTDAATYYAVQTFLECQSEATAVTVELSELGIGELEPARLVFFPNPVSDVLHFSGDSLPENVVVFDLSGRTVKAASAQNLTSINLAGLATGTYLVRAETENGVQSFKINKR